MTKGSDQYPEDEFDAEPAQDVPIGVHRAPRTWWSRWWPFVAVLVLVPALTVGGVLWASSWDGRLPTLGSGSDDTPTATAPTSSAPAESTEPAEEAPVEEPPVEEEPPAPEPDLTVPITVLNAANVSGLAAGAASDLGGAGFTAVTAGNGSAGGATRSTVFYANADLAVTAQRAAEALGITNVVESADAAGDAITVLLLRDFAN